jgi:hypothetical protein
MSDLKTEVTTEEIDCGKAITTKTFDADGNLVSQGVEIIVDPAKLPKMGAEVGDL